MAFPKMVLTLGPILIGMPEPITFPEPIPILELISIPQPIPISESIYLAPIYVFMSI